MFTMSPQAFAMVLKAREFWKTLGPKTAAGYLRNRGFTIGQTLAALGLPNRFGFF